MTEIHVCSLVLVDKMVTKMKPSHVVSLLGPGTPFPEIEGMGPSAHHCVELDDIRKPIEGYETPGERHVAGVIDFLKTWNPERPLLTHCWAGISRSSVTAFIAACLHNPEADEFEIANKIAEVSPTAYPNTLIAAIADDILGRDGRMKRAAQEICSDPQRVINIRKIDETVPFSIPGKF